MDKINSFEMAPAFEYDYQNIGQFRAIMSELGFSEEYHSKMLKFSNKEATYCHSFEEIREYSKKPEDISEKLEASQARLSFFFDNERAVNDFAAYSKELNEVHNVSVVKWNNIKEGQVGNGKSADGFSIIDHENRISYTGQSLYQFGYENGYIFDGKGTQLEEGQYSPLTTIDDRKAKVYRGKNGTSVFYSKEALVIPDEIFNHKLTGHEKELLKRGDIVPVTNLKNNTLYLQVDKDINAIIIRSKRELNVPNVIGKNDKYNFPGTELSNADKMLLANGLVTEKKLVCGDDGFFLAELQMTADKKGMKFINVETISTDKAKEIFSSQHAALKNELSGDYTSRGKEELEQDKGIKPDNKDKELFDALEKDDFIKVNDLKNEGYRPSEKALGVIEKMDLSESKKIAVNKIFGIKEESISKNKLADEKKAGVDKGLNQQKTKQGAVTQSINRLFSDM